MEKKIIAFQLEVNLYEKLRKTAYEKHLSISEAIRFILENYYKEEECQEEK